MSQRFHLNFAKFYFLIFSSIVLLLFSTPTDLSGQIVIKEKVVINPSLNKMISSSSYSIKTTYWKADLPRGESRSFVAKTSKGSSEDSTPEKNM